MKDQLRIFFQLARRKAPLLFERLVEIDRVVEAAREGDLKDRHIVVVG